MLQPQAIEPSQNNYLQEMTVLINKKYLSMIISTLYEYKKYCVTAPDKIEKLSGFIQEFEAIDPYSQNLNLSRLVVRQAEILSLLGVRSPADLDPMVPLAKEEVAKQHLFNLGYKRTLNLGYAQILDMKPSELLAPDNMEFVIRFLELFISGLSDLVKENKTHVGLLGDFSKWFSENKAKLSDEKIANIITRIPKLQELSEIVHQRQEQLLPPVFLGFFNSPIEDIIKEGKAADDYSDDVSGLEKDVRIAEEAEKAAKLAYEAAQKRAEDLRSKLSASKPGTPRAAF